MHNKLNAVGTDSFAAERLRTLVQWISFVFEQFIRFFIDWFHYWPDVWPNLVGAVGWPLWLWCVALGPSKRGNWLFVSIILQLYHSILVLWALMCRHETHYLQLLMTTRVDKITLWRAFGGN
jgi:hypothetical protein